MNTKIILEEAKKYVGEFHQILQDEKFQSRGIINSEALLLITLIQYYDVENFIESGRARGYSTNLIAKYFKGTNIKITSIDFDEKSEDAKYSEKLLTKYPNVNLIYGDSQKIIESEVKENCVVFIDGPKGDEAIQLGARLLKNKLVKAVAIHDLPKDTWNRDICETIFSDYFFSDDTSFVREFKHVDAECWSTLSGTGMAPYLRHGNKTESYGSTLGIFFNSDTPLSTTSYENSLSYYNDHQATLKSVFINSVTHDSVLYKLIKKIHNAVTKK